MCRVSEYNTPYKQAKIANETVKPHHLFYFLLLLFSKLDLVCDFLDGTDALSVIVLQEFAETNERILKL